MSGCPHKVRSDLPPLTDRIAKLPVDERGYPVPFFVQWLDADEKPTEITAPGAHPEFRIASAEVWNRCVKEHLCWVCGEKLGRYGAFTIGPMCCINRTSAEPPAHLECADWSVKGCPFLSKPQMERRESGLSEEIKERAPIGGIMLKRNPGAICIWVTESFTIFRDGKGGLLIEIGEPFSTSWWKLGREATRAEVVESVVTGLPFLVEQARGQGDLDEIKRRHQWMTENVIPRE